MKKLLALKIGGYEVGDPIASGGGKNFSDIGSIVSALLPYLIIFAGLIFFGAMIFSGFSFLTSGGDPKKTESAKGCLTNSMLGFVIVFISYFLIKLVDYIFGLGMF